MKMIARSLAAALLLAAASVMAQSQPRTLEVPATASWQHAATGMILPPRAAGLSRGSIVDQTADEQDVSVGYGGEEGLTTSLYLFQTPLPDPALWTDRALVAIQLRPDLGLDAGTGPAAAPFRRPGAAAASGLRATLPLARSGLTSTAVAVAPLAGWLIKIRMTSARLDAAALDARLNAFIEALRWPAEGEPAPAATAVLPCRDSLTFKKARIVRDDMTQVLMNAVSGVAAAAKDGAQPTVYCREPGPLRAWGVYRPDAARDAYVIALGDAGQALSLAPTLDLDSLLSGRAGSKRISMTRLQHDRTEVLPSFNRLPPPEQALAVAESGRSSGISVTTSPGQDQD